MTMTEAIIARKAVRSYNTDTLPEEVIEDITDYISELTAPDTSIDWNFDILPYDELCYLIDAVPKLRAPHYLILRSVKQKGCLQNAGYVGEMTVLYMTTLGIATCWQGGFEAKRDYEGALPYIIAIAFGYSDEPFRESAAESKRKNLSQIASGELSGEKGQIIEAARLAPSGMGMEPCRFTVLANRINVYRKKNLIRFPAISYVQCVDVGIAIAHIDVAAQSFGYTIKCEKQEPPPIWNKNIYQATVHLTSN